MAQFHVSTRHYIMKNVLNVCFWKGVIWNWNLREKKSESVGSFSESIACCDYGWFWTVYIVLQWVNNEKLQYLV